MNYGAINTCDAANGPGVRVSLFVSGCQKALDGLPCKGCQNKEAWDKNYGKKFTEETKNEIMEAMRKDYISGFSLLGGEPLSIFNIQEEINLLKEIKNNYPKKDIWLWTGYVLENWLNDPRISSKTFDPKEILNYVDVVVDGPYIEALRDPSLKFRGSSNQQIIYLKDKNLH